MQDMFDGTGMRIFEISSDGIKILRLLARVNSRRPWGVALFVSFTWSEIEPGRQRMSYEGCDISIWMWETYVSTSEDFAASQSLSPLYQIPGLSPPSWRPTLSSSLLGVIFEPARYSFFHSEETINVSLTSPDALAKSMEWRSPSSVMASSSSRSHMIVSKVSSGALKITRLSRRCRGFVHSQDSKSLLPSLGTCNTLARVRSRQLN